jgi:hypothetical protein
MSGRRWKPTKSDARRKGQTHLMRQALMEVCVRENSLSRLLSWPLLVICYILMLNSTSTKDCAFIRDMYLHLHVKSPILLHCTIEINLVRCFQALETSDASYSYPQLTTWSQVLCHSVTPIWYRTRNYSATLSVGHTKTE